MFAKAEALDVRLVMVVIGENLINPTFVSELAHGAHRDLGVVPSRGGGIAVPPPATQRNYPREVQAM